MSGESMAFASDARGGHARATVRARAQRMDGALAT